MSSGQVVGWWSEHRQLKPEALSLIPTNGQLSLFHLVPLMHLYLLLSPLQTHISLLFCLVALPSETSCLTIPGIPPPPSPPLPSPFSPPPLPLLPPSPPPSPPPPRKHPFLCAYLVHSGANYLQSVLPSCLKGFRP